MSTAEKHDEYSPIAHEEAAWSETESSDLWPAEDNSKRVHSRWKPRVYCNAAGCFIGAFCLAVTIVATIQLTILFERRGSNAPRWRPAFSPVYDVVNVPLVTAYVDGSPSANESDPRHIYRLPPSPAVDAAWDRLNELNKIFPVSASDIVRMGKDPSLAVKVPESWDFPSDKPHMMGIEAFHQLHCLNALRKGLVTNYDYYWGSQYGFTPPAVFTRHLNHCVDILRQHLMCHADMEGFVFNWRETQIKPYADFDIKKKCIDFNYLLEFAESHRKPNQDELWELLEKPEDAKQREAPGGLPRITNETIWDGRVPLAKLPGLEEKEYCLGQDQVM